jgi:hypothetical protein
LVLLTKAAMDATVRRNQFCQQKQENIDYLQYTEFK